MMRGVAERSVLILTGCTKGNTIEFRHKVRGRIGNHLGLLYDILSNSKLNLKKLKEK
jgi:hypothetical protein